jgi:hypothetical protein
LKRKAFLTGKKYFKEKMVPDYQFSGRTEPLRGNKTPSELIAFVRLGLRPTRLPYGFLQTLSRGNSLAFG